MYSEWCVCVHACVRAHAPACMQELERLQLDLSSIYSTTLQFQFIQLSITLVTGTSAWSNRNTREFDDHISQQKYLLPDCITALSIIATSWLKHDGYHCLCCSLICFHTSSLWADGWNWFWWDICEWKPRYRVGEFWENKTTTFCKTEYLWIF